MNTAKCKMERSAINCVLNSCSFMAKSVDDIHRLGFGLLRSPLLAKASADSPVLVMHSFFRVPRVPLNTPSMPFQTMHTSVQMAALQ